MPAPTRSIGWSRILLPGGCTETTIGSDTTGLLGPPVTNLSEATRNYLQAVHSIESDTVAGFVGIGESLGRVYNTREAIFTVISESGIVGVVNNTLTRAKALNSPPEYETDHQIWLAFHQDLVRLMDDLEVALEERNLQALTRATTEALHARAQPLLEVSDSFCDAVNPEFPELCRRTQGLPGGEYGQAVYEIGRAQALASAGMFDFPPDMTEEERAVRLEYVQPHIKKSLMTARDELANLTPPPELSADHQILLAFFTEQYQTALAISAANAERDTPAVLELFDRSSEVADELKALSDTYRELVPQLLGP